MTDTGYTIQLTAVSSLVLTSSPYDVTGWVPQVSGKSDTVIESIDILVADAGVTGLSDISAINRMLVQAEAVLTTELQVWLPLQALWLPGITDPPWQ